MFGVYGKVDTEDIDAEANLFFYSFIKTCCLVSILGLLMAWHFGSM
jgi:hypothetical protein